MPLTTNIFITVDQFTEIFSQSRNSIIIRTAFMTERTSDTKGTDKFINNFVLEFTASVGMENAYFGKINAATEKCIVYKLCVFICTG